MPVVMQRTVPTVLRGQKTMNALQVQFWDEAVDAETDSHNQRPEKRCRLHRCISARKFSTCQW